ncbi:hypothetical protein M9458_021203, partial [Cirrhinus mrigala]
VLCRESVCGRCYWEIECSRHIRVHISVSYKSISRKGRGNECLFGSNDQSWSLICSPDSYSFRHNKIETDLPVKPIISRIGVSDDDNDDYFSRTELFDDDNDDYFSRTELFDDDSDDYFSRTELFDDDNDDYFSRTGVSDDDHNDDDVDDIDDDDDSRIGVYVDVSAGTLSFYSVYRNSMSLIHKVQTTFTQTLYPG